jgi:large subunit ribosomal protein L29
MKSSEIRELSNSDLQDKLAVEREALAKINFTHGISSLENPMELRQRRKNIARLLTEVGARNKKA